MAWVKFYLFRLKKKLSLILSNLIYVGYYWWAVEKIVIPEKMRVHKHTHFKSIFKFSVICHLILLHMLKIREMTKQKDESSALTMQTLAAPSVCVWHESTNVNAVLTEGTWIAPMSNTCCKGMLSESCHEQQSNYSAVIRYMNSKTSCTDRNVWVASNFVVLGENLHASEPYQETYILHWVKLLFMYHLSIYLSIIYRMCCL